MKRNMYEQFDDVVFRGEVNNNVVGIGRRVLVGDQEYLIASNGCVPLSNVVNMYNVETGGRWKGYDVEVADVDNFSWDEFSELVGSALDECSLNPLVKPKYKKVRA